MAGIEEDSAGAVSEPFWDSLLFSSAICSVLGLVSKNGRRQRAVKWLKTNEKVVFCDLPMIPERLVKLRTFRET